MPVCRSRWLTQVLFKYAPYFYVSVEEGLEREVESVLRRKFAEEIADVVQKDMWDLDMPNHFEGAAIEVLQGTLPSLETLHVDTAALSNPCGVAVAADGKGH